MVDHPKRVMGLDVDALERARINRGLLRRDVARLAGISTVTVWRAFSTGVVGVKIARRIAKCLGLRLSSLWVEMPPWWRLKKHGRGQADVCPEDQL